MLHGTHMEGAGISMGAALRSMLMVPSPFMCRCGQSTAVPLVGASTGDGLASARQRRACPTLRHHGRMAWFDLGDVSWLGVAVATLAAFTFSFVWYHPRALGTVWARAVGADFADLRARVATRGAVAVVVLAATATVMCVLQAELLVVSIGGGLLFGAVLGALLRLAWGLMHGENESRPIALTVIDGVHDVLALALIGAVLGAFL